MRYLYLAILIIGSVSAQENFQDKILEAKRKVFPALVHIQPVKEFFSEGEK